MGQEYGIIDNIRDNTLQWLRRIEVENCRGKGRMEEDHYHYGTRKASADEAKSGSRDHSHR
jgi:hypothetical protein